MHIRFGSLREAVIVPNKGLACTVTEEININVLTGFFLFFKFLSLGYVNLPGFFE